MIPTDRDPNLTAGLQFTTLIELLRWRALHQPEHLAYTFLLDGETEEVSFTYQSLDQQARSIGAKLQALEARGERALLLYPPGLDYIAAFFGCLYAGMIAIPAYPPRLNRPMPRLQAIVSDAGVTVALTTTQILSSLASRFDHLPDLKALRWLATDTLVDEPLPVWQTPAITSSTVAFFQYTSGSTTAPKGVILTHGNLLHNLALIHKCFETSADSRGVIWLPPYHDMGLIGGVLQPLYGGFPVILMSPVDFLQRPARWLQAISRSKATVSGGPNFAYEWCVNKITPEQRSDLDLSSWQLAFSGAEPIRPETLDRFATAFASCGFRREAFYPCYGLAEATLIVSGGDKSARPMLRRFNTTRLEHRQAVETSSSDASTRALVSCGHALADQEILIVDPEQLTPCAPDQIGEIWLSGPSVAQGYWNRPEETVQTFRARVANTDRGPFLRTGDLGFLQNGELFVAGRLKDLIIIRGRNHYPQDIELTVEQSHPILRAGCGAAFSVEVTGEEQLVIAQEVERHYRNTDLAEVVQAIRQAVAAEHDLQVYAVVLLKTGSLPKTSSGKIQRHVCRAGFLENGLEKVAQSFLEVHTEGAPPIQSETSSIRQALTAAQDQTARQSLLTLYLQAQAAHVLKIAPARVNPQQSLGTLGLDSLTAVELTHKVETELGMVLSMVDFLQAPDLTQLAAYILAKFDAPSAGPVTRLVSIPATTSEQPLSYGQRAMWFLHQLAPTSAAYNIANAVQVEGQLDMPALQQAFQALVDRHPALRTTFPVVQGEPVQHINEQSTVYFQVEEAATWSTASLTARLLEEAQRPFDLVQGPLLRVHLFRRSAQECILLLVVHHIVSDFWSLAVLVRELGVLYPAKKRGDSITLAPLSLQYSDYTHWQATMLAGAEGEQLWTYWKGQLSGELPVLNLPTDHPRPAVQTFHGSSQALHLNIELTERLKSFSRAHGSTLYTTLLAAFQTLLYRYTGQADILIGSPTADRTEASLAGLVGYFVNPVALRGDASGNPSFVTFLSRVRRTVLEATAHQDYPFSLLVERLQPERDPSRSPIFQVWFVLQQSPWSEVADLAAFALQEAGASIPLGDLTLKSVALEQRTTQFDLALAVADTAGGMRVSLQYNCDLFEADTIDRMLRHFQTLLEGIIADPARRLSDLPLLPIAEQQQILQNWNATSVAYDRERCLPHWFEAQARQTPNALAVVFEGRSLTYRELDQRANQLAHYLQQLGVGSDTLVALCVDRSLEMIVGLLGILKAGGAYVPLDPAYPRDRLTYIFEDTQSSVLLTQQRLRDHLQPHNCHVVCLDTDWESVAGQSDEPPRCQVCADHLAYVIYTSGSTGKPKGVQVTHRAVVNFLNAMCQRPGLTAEDVLLSVTTLSFDIAGLELFLPLVVGAAVELASREVIADGQRLAARLTDSGATLMQATPTLWRLLLETGWPGNPRLRVLCGGEAFPRDLANQLLERVATVWNMYGPTETTIWSTTGQVEPGTETVSIGQPIANTQIYLLDRYLNPVPIGQEGELYIGGDGLARGYLNHPALTAEKFIPHPFSSVPGARLYRTGDLARYRATGDLEILGRIDHQIKLRGYRIELAEIETRLCQHPAVQAAVVLVREDSASEGERSSGPSPREKRLVAYVVLDQAQAIETNELRSFLKKELPDYMLPSVFVTLAAFPLTPNGKVDRRALPAPEGQRPTLEIAYVVPQTQLERRIAVIWQNVLQVDKVGLHDNFFELGGHSVLMAKVHSQLQAEGLAEASSIVELFQYPTVHSLAHYLSGKEAVKPNLERAEARSARESSMQQQKERRRQLRGR